MAALLVPTIYVDTYHVLGIYYLLIEIQRVRTRYLVSTPIVRPVTQSKRGPRGGRGDESCTLVSLPDQNLPALTDAVRRGRCRRQSADRYVSVLYWSTERVREFAACVPATSYQRLCRPV
jgi:hypothetical protein